MDIEDRLNQFPVGTVIADKHLTAIRVQKYNSWLAVDVWDGELMSSLHLTRLLSPEFSVLREGK